MAPLRTMSVKEKTQRIPAALWESLQDVCYAQDVQFIKDVAKIIGQNANDVRRRILGPRGESTVVLVDSDPWWIGTSCCLQERGPNGLWSRCNKGGESNGYCWGHRNFSNPSFRLKRADDPYFEGLLRRYPVRLLGEIVWVCEQGTVLGSEGIRSDVTIDVKTCVAKF